MLENLILFILAMHLLLMKQDHFQTSNKVDPITNLYQEPKIK